MTVDADKDRTLAEQEVVRVMNELLEPGRRYRVGALLLAYRDTDGQTRVANGLALQEGAVLADSGPELAALVERLGELQADIRAVMAGEKALPIEGLRPLRGRNPWAWKAYRKGRK